MGPFAFDGFCQVFRDVYPSQVKPPRVQLLPIFTVSTTENGAALEGEDVHTLRLTFVTFLLAPSTRHTTGLCSVTEDPLPFRTNLSALRRALI
jgi:hypothetical protein